MGDRFNQASELIKDAKKCLFEIEGIYKTSLQKKEIEIGLRITIKGLLENLRSALDYVANDLYNCYCSASANKAKKIYFPIASKESKQSDFNSLVENKIPGLLKNRPDLVRVLKSFQVFSSLKNSWLPDLATLSNENKHEKLTPQIRKESERIIAKSKSGTVSWDPRSVRFGAGVYINGVPIDPRTQLPISSPRQTVSREIWVDFVFDTIGQSALPFLKKCVLSVEDIVDRLRSAT